MVLFSLIMLFTSTILRSDQAPSKPPITIWVHGTKRLPGIAPVSFVKRFFHCNQGLHKFDALDTSFHHRKICDYLIAADAQRFQSDHLYLFGWSGKLNVHEREKAAENLSHEIKNLIESYERTYGITPFVRIITHSHGGNVVLNMAKFDHASAFVVDELILLACPVQKKTAHLIKSPLFKTIYSFYSVVDMIQVADPQGLYHDEQDCPIFSGRRFPEQPNLVQQEVRIYHRPIMHVEFMLSHFLKRLPSLLDQREK